MADNETVLDVAHLTSLMRDDGICTKLAKWLLHCGDDYEQSFELVCLLHDVPNVTSFRDIRTQLVANERNLGRKHRPSNETSVPPVDPVQLLGIVSKIGLKCPECHERETRYKLVANRRADEGMIAHCTCRQCNHQWRIAM